MLRVACACLLVLGLRLDAAGQTPGQPLPRSALPLELVGVMTDSSDPARSACLIRCTYPAPRRSASMLVVGATACDVAEISEIRPDAVIVRNLGTNRLELVELMSPAAPPAGRAAEEAPAPLVVKATADVVDVEVPKASVSHYLLNLSELLSSAQATPRYIDGENGQRAVEGFEISQIKAGGVVEQIGLKNGDVILEVNGEKLDSLPTVMRLFGQVQAATRATLTVVRGSQRMTFVFNTK